MSAEVKLTTPVSPQMQQGRVEQSALGGELESGLQRQHEEDPCKFTA